VANTSERIYTSYPLKMQVKTLRIQSNTYATPLKMEKIDWVISADVKTVAELTCMKAVGSFGGRTYTVWFTTSIAVPLGPWKLHGLPGVILEAVDSKGQVSFKAVEILQNIPPYNTELPKNFIAASQNDIEKLMKAKENGASIGSGGDISIAGVKLEGGTQGQRKPLQFNNPLELKQ
jgi:GLPGLI family protein